MPALRSFLLYGRSQLHSKRCLKLCKAAYTLFLKILRSRTTSTIFIQEPLFPRWLFNSVFVAVTVVIFNLLLNSMAGYALARISFYGSKFWFFLILAVLMIPFQVTLIPSYLLLKWFGFLNEYQGLIVPGLISAQFIFLMRQFFLSFPREMEEAAFMDGMGRWGIFLSS